MQRNVSRMNRTSTQDAPPISFARWTARVLGVVFAMVAVLGYVGGRDVLGLVPTNPAHSTLHLLTGLGLLLAGFTGEAASRLACWLCALAYGLIGLLGLAGVAGVTAALNLNVAWMWLYLALAIGWIAVAGVSQSLAHSRYRARAARRPA